MQRWRFQAVPRARLGPRGPQGLPDLENRGTHKIDHLVHHAVTNEVRLNIVPPSF